MEQSVLAMRWVESRENRAGPVIVRIKKINGVEVTTYYHLQEYVKLTYSDGHTDALWQDVPRV